MPLLQRLASALAVSTLLLGVVACGGDDDAKPVSAKTVFCIDFNTQVSGDTPVKTLQAILEHAKAAALKAPSDVAAAITVFVGLGDKAIAQSDGTTVTKATMAELGLATAGLDDANQKVIDYCAGK